MDDLAAMLHPWTCLVEKHNTNIPVDMRQCHRAAAAIAPRLTPDREHRPEALDGVPTGWCECGRPYPHTGEEPDRG